MSSKPVAASFCATFLAAEMRHVYRQIAGLQNFEPLILTHKRQNADDFPFPEDRIVTLPRPASRELRRFWARRITQRPWQIYQSEVSRIETVLRVRRATVLHVWFGHIGMHLLPLLRSTTRPCPIVVSFHGADASVDLEKHAYLEAVRSVFAHADAVLVRSQSLADELEAIGCPPGKIRLQRTGLPLDEWPLAEQRTVPQDGAWHLVQTCRLIEKKGLDVTLRALAKARETFPRMHLSIAGDGPLRVELESLSAELRIADAVQFVGFLDQAAMRQLYVCAHVFIHPSRVGRDGNREGVPNSMLEAMATGLPVIATRHGGIPDAIDHGVQGYLEAEEDVEGIAGSLREMLSPTGRWKKMSQATRPRVIERFEQGAQIAALEAIYRDVIEQR